MTSSVPVIFEGLARRFNIPGADVELLKLHKVKTCEDFYFKLPDEAELKKFLETELRVSTAERDDDQKWVPIERPELLSGEEFLRSDLAANVRKLWVMSKKQSSKDMDEFTKEMTDEKATVKINKAVIQNLVDEAQAGGLDLSDPKKLPGRWCLSRTLGTYMPVRGTME